MLDVKKHPPLHRYTIRRKEPRLCATGVASKIDDKLHRLERTKSRRVPRRERHTTTKISNQQTKLRQRPHQRRTSSAPIVTPRTSKPHRERSGHTLHSAHHNNSNRVFPTQCTHGHGTNCGNQNCSQSNMPRAQTQSPQDTKLQSLRWNRICRSHVQPNNTKQRRYCLQSETCTIEKHQI